MHEWTTLMYAHQRVNELRQDREKQRIIQQALQAGARPEPLYAPALAWMGRQLMTWGETLQTRYADIETTSATAQQV